MDREFIDDAIDKAGPFNKLAILPELMGKWFTKQNVTVNDDKTPQEPDQEDEDRWCYYNKIENFCLIAPMTLSTCIRTCDS